MLRVNKDLNRVEYFNGQVIEQPSMLLDGDVFIRIGDLSEVKTKYLLLKKSMDDSGIDSSLLTLVQFDYNKIKAEEILKIHNYLTSSSVSGRVERFLKSIRLGEINEFIGEINRHLFVYS